MGMSMWGRTDVRNENFLIKFQLFLIRAAQNLVESEIIEIFGNRKIENSSFDVLLTLEV